MFLFVCDIITSAYLIEVMKKGKEGEGSDKNKCKLIYSCHDVSFSGGESSLNLAVIDGMPVWVKVQCFACTLPMSALSV